MLDLSTAQMRTAARIAARAIMANPQMTIEQIEEKILAEFNKRQPMTQKHASEVLETFAMDEKPSGELAEALCLAAVALQHHPDKTLGEYCEACESEDPEAEDERTRAAQLKAANESLYRRSCATCADTLGTEGITVDLDATCAVCNLSMRQRIELGNLPADVVPTLDAVAALLHWLHAPAPDQDPAILVAQVHEHIAIIARRLQEHGIDVPGPTPKGVQYITPQISTVIIGRRGMELIAQRTLEQLDETATEGDNPKS